MASVQFFLRSASPERNSLKSTIGGDSMISVKTLALLTLHSDGLTSSDRGERPAAYIAIY